MTSELESIDEDIQATKEGFGATFILEAWGGVGKVKIALTENEAASMLLMATGSVERAMEALAFESSRKGLKK